MKYLLILVCIATAMACSNTNNQSSAGNELPALLERYYQERLKLFPLEATQNGDNRYNNRLNIDFTQSFRDTLRNFYNSYLQEVTKFNREELNNNDQLSYDIFKREMEMSLEGLQQPDNRIPFQQFWGLPLTMGQLGSGDGNQPFKTIQDYDNWLQRASKFPAWADSAIVYFRKGIAEGFVLPKSLVVKMIPQMRSMITINDTASLFYGPIRKLPASITGADKDRLDSAYRQLISQQLVPAYTRLADFLQNEYLPKARTTSGISALPGGKEYYNYLIRYWTTTNKTPDEIYNTGLAEVQRIRQQMDSVKNAVGFKGDLNAFFEYMRTDKQFMPYNNAEEVLSAFRAIQTRIDPNLQKMFGRTPKTPFEIRQTEAFRAASASAEYNQGSPDGSRPGIFYVPIVDAKTYNTTSGMESLFLHEAIPGHHYQISLQQENESLPKFRRFAWYGAYGEGWALYTESLGKELGLYTDPYQYMGALGDEIHRAIRLVVDVGLHTKGWTREQAIKYMMDNEAISEQGATAEIERYMAIPAQAISYKIGSLKIWDLRNKYQQQLGQKFNLSAYHDELLKDGVMPLDVLERKMDRWANVNKK
ncbi:DUF885 domain-containing protein [Aridibaculum aurantiacum]|uniref:DUF885 domain-containing protein n=1 Tax=Aridibaculum aurantiacum TaxID=2810307 RepID=UPI001A964EBD|nr:DUF885 domain-containing protein [Aridibaculum aurantiacum]